MNINTADADTLAEVMVGIVPTLVMVIVNYRAECGVFESVYELVKLKGIGVALIEKNRNAVATDTDLKSGC